MLFKPPSSTPPNLSYPLMKGLIGWWLMNEGAGINTYDVSGNRKTGTLTNMANPATATSGWGSGKFGRAIFFDGVNDYVRFADTFTPGTPAPFSVMSWYKTTNTAQAAGILFGDRDAASGSGNKIGMSAGKFFVRSGGTTDNSVTVPSGSGWHHFGVTRDTANSWSIYVDGVETVIGTGPGVAAYVFNTLGANGSDISQLFLGSLDDVRIYNRALSAQELGQVYTNPFGMFRQNRISWFVPSSGVVNIGSFFPFMG